MDNEKKTLDVTSSKDFPEKVPDVKVVGNPDVWQLICKASSQAQGWMKSTKAMEIGSLGVLVQVSTQQDEHVAEAVTFVPFAQIKANADGTKSLVSSWPTGEAHPIIGTNLMTFDEKRQEKIP
jgi:hypothetical protein